MIGKAAFSSPVILEGDERFSFCKPLNVEDIDQLEPFDLVITFVRGSVFHANVFMDLPGHGPSILDFSIREGLSSYGVQTLAQFVESAEACDMIYHARAKPDAEGLCVDTDMALLRIEPFFPGHEHGTYNYLKNNCQHFAMVLLFGVHESFSVNFARDTIRFAGTALSSSFSK